MNVPGLSETRFMVLVQAIRDLANGSSNAQGSFTLAPFATQTVVQDARCRPNVRVVPVPLSAAAGAAPWWIKGVGDGTFTIGHDSTAAVDRAFSYELRRP